MKGRRFGVLLKDAAFVGGSGDQTRDLFVSKTESLRCGEVVNYHAGEKKPDSYSNDCA